MPSNPDVDIVRSCRSRRAGLPADYSTVSIPTSSHRVGRHTAEPFPVLTRPSRDRNQNSWRWYSNQPFQTCRVQRRWFGPRGDSKGLTDIALAADLGSCTRRFLESLACILQQSPFFRLAQRLRCSWTLSYRSDGSRHADTDVDVQLGDGGGNRTTEMALPPDPSSCIRRSFGTLARTLQ